MVVQAKDSNGNDILVFDPSGVYLDQAEQDDSQARFRIFGQSRLKRAGFKTEMMMDRITSFTEVERWRYRPKPLTISSP